MSVVRFRRPLALLQAAVLLSSLVAPIAALAATIQTDLWIYQDGDTVTVSGVDYGAAETVEIVTTDPASVEVDRGTAATDEAGSFTYQFVLHATVPGLYDVVGTGLTSGLTASTQFDPVSVTLYPVSFVWYRAVGGAIDVTVSGDWACQGNCDSATDVVVAIFPTNGAAGTVGGSAAATRTIPLGGATGNNVPWTTTFAFRSAPGAGQFAIPSDRRYDVQAVFHGVHNSNPVTAEAIRDDVLGIDTTRPASTIATVDPTAPGTTLTAGGTATDDPNATGPGAFSGLLGSRVHVELRSGTPGGALVGGSAQDVLVSGAGTWTYTLASRPTEPGTYCVVSTATDNASSGGNVQSPAASSCYVVASANHAPDAVDDAVAVDEDSGANLIDVLANDTDADAGDSLAVVAVGSATHGTAALDGGGVTYTPVADYCGTDSFGYTISDGNGGGDTATVTVTVSCVNDGPDAVDDGAAVGEDSLSNVIGVLANDTDPENDSLTIAAVGAATHGATANTASEVTYTPAPNFCGADSFDYTISDGNGGSDTATVDVAVACVNDAPTASIVSGPDLVDESSTSERLYEFAVGDADAGDTFDVADGSPSCGTAGLLVGGSLQLTSSGGTFSCIFPDGDDDTTVSVQVEDAAGASSNLATLAVHVSNVAPTVAFTTGDAVVSESGVVEHAYDYSIFDPGLDAVASVAVGCGSGGILVGGSETHTNVAGSFACTFPDGPASPVLTAAATDSDGDTGPGATFGVTVGNVAPTADFGNSGPIAEGSAGTVSFSNASDASPLDVAAGFLYSYDFDADGTFDVVDSASATAAIPAGLLADGPASFFVAGRITDKDGGFFDVATLVEVTNVAPTVTLTGPLAADEGQTKAYAFSVSDPGAETFSLDSRTCGANGSLAAPLSFDPATGAGSFGCAFADDGPSGTASDPSIVAVSVGDGDGGTDGDALTVTVSNLPPTITAVGFAFDPLTHAATATATFADAGLADTHSASFTWSIDGGPRTGLVDEGAHTATDARTLPVGCYSLSVSVEIRDDDTGVATGPVATSQVLDAYAIQFRPPIKDNERNLVKFNSVVPVKVVLLSSCAPGTTVTSASLFVTLSQGAGTELIEDSNIVVESVSAADSGQQMRVADGGYIYNLSTKGLGTSDYTIRIRLGSTTGPVLLDGVLRPRK